MAADAGIQESMAEVWYLKQIAFGPKDNKKFFNIITQNFNGPCSLIAICNILILRGKIEILPASRKTVSYEFLAHLVGEYLLLNCPDIDISAALSRLPHTQKGMDLNPLFTGTKSFRPAGDGGELDLFQHAGIELVHGWLVEPDSPEAAVLAKTPDYDSAVTLIAEADHITRGRLVLDDSVDAQQAGPSSAISPTLSDEDRKKIEDALTIRQFLDNTQSQLTYHGLFYLASMIKPGSLVALYRNLHLSVLHKADDDTSSLYCLVTDQAFLDEPSVVWERMEDVDGGWSTFVDSDFIKSSPAGGDFAGQTANGWLEAEMAQLAISDPGDLALAQQLQADEQNRARYERNMYLREQRRRQQAEIDRRALLEEKRLQKARKKEKDCLVM